MVMKVPQAVAVGWLGDLSVMVFVDDLMITYMAKTAEQIDDHQQVLERLLTEQIEQVGLALQQEKTNL